MNSRVDGNGDEQLPSTYARPWRNRHSASSLLRARSAVERTELNRLAKRHQATRLDRGLFQLHGAPVVPHYELAACALRLPAAIICLGSALAYHELTTSGSQEVWLGLPRGRHAPRWTWPRIHPVYLSPYGAGIVNATIDGVAVRITDVERTVAECWQHEHVAGRDLCLEATRNAITRKTDISAILRHAAEFGVTPQVTLVIQALHA
jgi:predicted transcriptional regulator of viral defense system